MTADETLRRAADLHRAGDPAAESLLREVLAADPDHAGALSLLGLVLSQAGRRAEALPAWRRAAELRPADAGHRYNLGELLRQLGHPAEAEAEFRAAVALAPDWPEAHF